MGLHGYLVANLTLYWGFIDFSSSTQQGQRTVNTATCYSQLYSIATTSKSGKLSQTAVLNWHNIVSWEPSTVTLSWNAYNGNTPCIGIGYIAVGY